MTEGENIYRIRNQLNLTQREFAEKCGVSQSAINYWESGKRIPKFSHILNMSGALGISATEFMDKDKVDKNKMPAVYAFLHGEKEQVDLKECLLVKNYKLLNKLGRDEALKRISELTEIKKYTEPDNET